MNEQDSEQLKTELEALVKVLGITESHAYYFKLGANFARNFIEKQAGEQDKQEEAIKPSPHRVSFEDFKDIYQYAFGGCNEEFLKEKYIDWLGVYDAPNANKPLTIS